MGSPVLPGAFQHEDSLERGNHGSDGLAVFGCGTGCPGGDPPGFDMMSRGRAGRCMVKSSMRWKWGVAVLALGCARVTAPETPAPAPAPPPPQAPPPVVQEPPAPTGIYALDEAARDALSGPWTYIGTGPWTGNHRVQACAYRNERVIVVNVYCTITEVKAFRVDVFSPARGRVRIYAEGKAPVSTMTRKDYFTFNAESEPPPGARAGLPPVTLTMSFEELRNYDERRYQRFLPSCYGGVEIHRRQGGCLRGLASHAAEWAETNRSFLQEPPEDWYRIVRELRALASQHGRDD
jgi:hypothetical protein